MNSFLILLFLILSTACTNAVPTITRMVDFPAPALENANLSISDLSTSVEFKGICSHKRSDKFMISLDKTNWTPISDILDLSKINDMNCSDLRFDFYIDSSFFNLSPTGDIVMFYLKSFSEFDESLVSSGRIELTQITSPIITPDPSSSPGSSIVVLLSIGSVPYLLTKSPVVNISVTSTLPIVSITGYVKNNLNQIIIGPMPVSNNSNQQMTGLTLKRNTEYTVFIDAVDNSGSTGSSTISFTTANCVSSDPNDVSVNSGLCSDISVSDATGWKMQGGIILGLDTYTTQILVVGESTEINSQTWDSTTSGQFVPQPNIANLDPIDPSLKANIGTGPIGTCVNSSRESFGNWFLPAINQMSKLICRSNFNVNIIGQPLPQTDPYCSGSGVMNIYSLSNSYDYWTSTEESVSKSYVADNNGKFEAKSKSSHAAVLCMRRFDRNQ